MLQLRCNILCVDQRFDIPLKVFARIVLLFFVGLNQYISEKYLFSNYLCPHGSQLF